MMQSSQSLEAFENVGSTFRNVRNGKRHSKWKKLYWRLIKNCEKAKRSSIWKGTSSGVKALKTSHLHMSGSVEIDNPGEKQ